MAIKEKEYLGGLIVEDISPDDWLFGGKVWPIVLPGGDWRKYKPNPELQATKYVDPWSCVSESGPDNAVSELLNLMMEQDPSVKIILERLQMLDDNGKANISGRFVAVGSGTIPGRGNSQKAVYEFVRKNGLVGEKVWPTNPEMTEAQYFATIPEDVKKLALEFLKYFDFNWERIGDGVNFTKTEMKQATEKGPVVVCVGGAYLGKYLGAMLYRNDGPVNYIHQTNYLNQEQDVVISGETFDVLHDIFDTYDPIEKRYAPNYPFKYGIVHYLTKKKIPMLYKKIGQPAICFKHWSEPSLIAFADGAIQGGDLFKSLFGTDKYSDLPREDVVEWPFPIKYQISTSGLIFGFEEVKIPEELQGC